MKFFKNKKIKILCIVLIIIFILYLILFISRIDTSKGIIKDVSKDTILVLIDGKSYSGRTNLRNRSYYVRDKTKIYTLIEYFSFSFQSMVFL